MKRIILTVILLLVFSPYMVSKDINNGLLTLDKIFKSKEFRYSGYASPNWDESGNYIYKIKKTNERYSNIVKYDIRTGKEEIFVYYKSLLPNMSKKELIISSFKVSNNKKYLLIYTNTKRVWRRNTRGDYWILNIKTGELYKLGENAEESTLQFAKFSPNSKYVGYVMKNNIYIQNIKTKKITKLTNDGDKNIINGTSDWVYEEEFRLNDCFSWNYKSNKIAFWKFDQSNVPEFYLINNTDNLYPKLKIFHYPKAGQKNSIVKLGIINIDNKKIDYIDLKDKSKDYYLPQMKWFKSKNKILFQKLNRLQNRVELYVYDADKLNLKKIYEERDNTWIDIHKKIYWLKKDKEFLWISEKDGWRHLYSLSIDSGKLKKLTDVNFDVIRVLSVDNRHKRIYFSASPDNATQKYLYSTYYKKTTTPKRITPIKYRGTNSYNISPNNKYAYHTYSNINFPPITNLISLKTHKIIKNIKKNKDFLNKLKKLKLGKTELFEIKIDNNIKLDGWRILPYNFNPNKKYPVLFYIYGEPAGTTVKDSWIRNYLWYQYLSQNGYIIMSMDNRGTPAPKGREWRKVIYKKIGIIVENDQSKAVKELLKKYKYMDKNRIGIWGWSGGGTQTLNMVFRHPEIYKMGIAVAPVPDLTLYDSIYQERYMGLPQTNKKEYFDCSPINHAKNLKSKLLIVHGTGDDNVHIQGTERLINKLVEYNKMFSMMFYPNRSHGIYEGKNTTRHLFYTLTEFIFNNL